MSRALIIDDEKSIRFSFSKRLKKEGIEADTADGWGEAEDLINSTEYDVIFLDVMMPGKDGIEVLQEIMKVQPDTTVIMMTGDPSVQKAVDSYQSGAVDYLKKPVSKDKLLKIAYTAIERKALIKEREKLTEEKEDFEKRLDDLLSGKLEEMGSDSFKDLADDLVKHRKKSAEDLKKVSNQLSDALKSIRHTGKQDD